MFTEYEYSHYNKCIDEMYKGTHLSLIDEDDECPIELWDDTGERTTLDFVTEVNFYDWDNRVSYYIAVISGAIIFEYYGIQKGHDKYRNFSTANFKENTDEEFFQVSTVQDVSFMDETLLRRLIDISLLLRNNKQRNNNV